MSNARTLCRPTSPFLTVGDLEELLRLHRRTILRLCKSGVLPRPMKIGGSNRWSQTAVLCAIGKLAGEATSTTPFTEETHDHAQRHR